MNRKIDIGDNIKFYRQNAKLTQKQLGEDNRHLLLVRAKELVNLEAEHGGYLKMNAS